MGTFLFFIKCLFSPPFFSLYKKKECGFATALSKSGLPTSQSGQLFRQAYRLDEAGYSGSGKHERLFVGPKWHGSVSQNLLSQPCLDSSFLEPTNPTVARLRNLSTFSNTDFSHNTHGTSLKSNTIIHYLFITSLSRLFVYILSVVYSSLENTKSTG
jgi:hypothetical protein